MSCPALPSLLRSLRPRVGVGACIGRVGAAAGLAVGLASAAVAAPPLAGAALAPPPPAAAVGAGMGAAAAAVVPGPLPAGGAAVPIDPSQAGGGAASSTAPSGAALLSGDGPLVISAPAQPPPPALLPTGLSPAVLGAAEPPDPRALPSAPPASAAPASAAPVSAAPVSPAPVSPAGSTPPAASFAAPLPVPASGARPAAASGLLPEAPALIPAGRELVLDRRRRRLEVRDNGITVRRFPVAVGMPGWETPVGRFAVFEKTPDPVWEHPQSGVPTPPGAANPLGSRWIGFHRDCQGRRGWDGERMLDVKGCVVAGFHGTPHRWTVGHAVSHGCVRLYDEDVRILFEMVRLGMPVTVLP